MALKEEWGFKFPLPSKNDSINLLYIQMEKAYFTLKFDSTDILAKRILKMDSTFYMALSFQAFGKWPFDLKKLELAKKYSSADTSIHRLIFEGDYSYWIKQDTATAYKLYTEVYNRYPDSKIAAWLAGMASLWSKKYEKASWYYNRALKIDSSFYHAYYDLGEVYLEKKEYRKSIKYFKIFLKYYPNKHRIHSVIGDSYIALKDSVNAGKHYRLADSLRKMQN